MRSGEILGLGASVAACAFDLYELMSCDGEEAADLGSFADRSLRHG